MTTVRIYVTYKPSVFDPQGAAITDSVNSLGHDEVKKIVVGKFFDVTVDEDDLDKIKDHLFFEFKYEGADGDIKTSEIKLNVKEYHSNL